MGVSTVLTIATGILNYEKKLSNRMTEEVAKYIFANYGESMTTKESLAFRHLAGALKATHGKSDLEAQEVARRHRVYSKLVSDDKEVLLLARDGYPAFVQTTSERIYRDNSDKIVLNRCAVCNGLARTPAARQCPHCQHDWHR